MTVLGTATPKSANRKTGPMAAIYRPVGLTCPNTCPLLNNGCYAQRGPAALVARRSQKKTFNFDDLINKMPRNINVIRLNVTGDFLDENGQVDKSYLNALIKAAKKYPDIFFYGYTHAWRELTGWLKKFPKNVKIWASVNSKPEASEAKAAGWDYARVTTEHDRERSEVYCPVDKAKREGREPDITCDKCRLCIDKPKGNIVFFKV